jgi:hypothetical protein
MEHIALNFDQQAIRDSIREPPPPIPQTEFLQSLISYQARIQPGIAKPVIKHLRISCGAPTTELTEMDDIHGRVAGPKKGDEKGIVQ